jgi:CheY-like chemotaxis protein
VDKRVTFLIVDDDDDDIGFFIEVLATIDPTIEVVAAIGGYEALDYLKNNLNNLPDRIFLDINMPRLSGLDVLEKIREDKKFVHLPITVYSTHKDTKAYEKCVSLNADFWIKTPYARELTKKLTEVVSMRGED